MAEVCLSSRAALQLREIYEYSAAQWGREKAAEYLAQVERCFGDLGENVLSGRARPELGPGYRSAVAGKHVVFYRSRNGKVVIVAVLHGQMDTLTRLVEKPKGREQKRAKKSTGKRKK
jgi:toxin ParE1/3/4